MNTMTQMVSLQLIRWGGMAEFHPRIEPRNAPWSTGDQQAAMALHALGEAAASMSGESRSEQVQPELFCPHCGAAMLLLEDQWLGASFHLSAECLRCGCLRAADVELTAAPRPWPELPSEATFD